MGLRRILWSMPSCTIARISFARLEPLSSGIVHRLDKETSGVMVIAKSEQAYHSLVSQFSDRKTQKKYCALVSGQLSGTEGEFNGAIARHPKVRVKMTVAEHGKPALTTWRLIKRFEEGFSFIDCEIKTGRTHQIRVHFSNASNPIAGDLTYGFKQNGKCPLSSLAVLCFMPVN